MQILTRLNKVIAYSETGYIPVGNTAICIATNDCYDDALIVDVDCVPTDIDKSDYYYINGRFVKGSPAKVEDMTAEELIDATDFEEGMNEDNVIPKATKDLLGCVIVGDGLEVDESGVLSNGWEMDLLWTNASPTSAFAAQTINLDLSEYDLIEIHFNMDASASTTIGEVTDKRIPVGKKAFCFGINGTAICSRNVTVSANSIVIEEGKAYGTYANATAYTTNTHLIPTIIYGIKGVS